MQKFVRLMMTNTSMNQFLLSEVVLNIILALLSHVLSPFLLQIVFVGGNSMLDKRHRPPSDSIRESTENKYTEEQSFKSRQWRFLEGVYNERFKTYCHINLREKKSLMHMS